MPVRHQGVQVGLFYLLDKTNEREFTEKDEETLALFAAQAGVAITNARKHHDEQQAKADLEALVNTTPVGVVVFDAKSGRLVSLNQEMRRIAGDTCKPGASIVEILDVLTVRRADGREIEPGEYDALMETLRESITVRAEEILLEMPDGRKVTTLINATPIISEEDEVLSVVVTMQDMTPIEEQERQRIEFLGMVSHELTAPRTTSSNLFHQRNSSPESIRHFASMQGHPNRSGQATWSSTTKKGEWNWRDIRCGLPPLNSICSAYYRPMPAGS